MHKKRAVCLPMLLLNSVASFRYISQRRKIFQFSLSRETKDMKVWSIDYDLFTVYDKNIKKVCLEKKKDWNKYLYVYITFITFINIKPFTFSVDICCWKKGGCCEEIISLPNHETFIFHKLNFLLIRQQISEPHECVINEVLYIYLRYNW